MTARLFSLLMGCALLAVMAPLSLADDRDVPEIGNVANLNQLQGAAEITTSDGWRIQLGLGPGGSGSGPWRLLYCLAKRTAKTAEAAGPSQEYGDPLGPVFLRVTDDAQPQLIQHSKRELRIGLPDEALYCQAIPIAWPGAYHIHLFARDGALLAQRKLEVADPQPCYWQPFAELRRHSDLDITPYVTRDRAVGAIVSFNGLTPVWKRRGQVEFEKSRGQIPLPGRVPSHPLWRGDAPGPIRERRSQDALPPALQLSLQDSLIVVDSPVPLIRWPDFHLLVRWWVNDRAIVPGRSDEIKMIQLGRLVTFSKRMHVEFRLPAALGDLDAGDKIGLQVLFTPAMHQQLPATRIIDSLEQLASQSARAVAMPLLSNRLDMIVTREMLAGRGECSR